MLRIAILFGALASVLFPAPQAVKPIKVGYYTGGGYHDYKKQAEAIPAAVEKLINAKFEVKWEREALRDPKFGQGYDVIVYNICWADEKDKDADLLEILPKVTQAGKPTVVIHGTLHSFRWVDSAWTECMGMKSRAHDPFQGFSTEKVEKAHPIVKFWPESWKTSGDELYITLKMYPNAKPLLNVTSPHNQKVSTVAWTNTYGKGKVFGCTLGHDQKTIDLPEYPQLLANGLLWVCDKLGDDGKPKKGYGK